MCQSQVVWLIFGYSYSALYDLVWNTFMLKQSREAPTLNVKVTTSEHDFLFAAQTYI